MIILVLIPNYFPYGTAISVRVSNFCKLFNCIGNNVHVIALYSNDEKETGTVLPLDYCTYQIVTDKSPSGKASFFGENEFVPAVEEYIDNNQVDAIFSSGIEPYYNKIIRICRKNSIPIYLEQCEWMDVSSYRFGKIDYRYIRRNNLLNGGYKSASGIVAISRLLQEHYTQLGIPTVRIPTIIDTDNVKPSYETANSRITLVYTGSPSTSKELLLPVISLLASNSEYRESIEFHIYGPSKETVIANIGGQASLLDEAGDSVVIHGRVPQEEMEAIQRSADYQIFIRPQRRSSDAGFPTKLAESMAVGTPVITNNTGDIGMYLKDGANGYLMQSGSNAELEVVMNKIIAMDSEQYSTMRKNARETAVRSFDYRKYIAKMQSFLMKTSMQENT